MSERADAWMPLYVADYLKDTQDLSAAEHGAYCLLLMRAWTSGGLLPLDEDRLRRITRMSDVEWRTSRAALLEFFRETPEGYRHKRVDRELARAGANIAQRSAAGKASAEARKAQREVQRNGNGRSTAVATEPPTNRSTEVQRNGRPSPSPSSLRSEPPSPPLPNGGGPSEYDAVLEAGGFVSPPGDYALVGEWKRAGADLEQDILPTIRRVAGEVRSRTGKAPFKLQLFDRDVRAKVAEDAAEIERLGKVTKRYAGGTGA